MLGGLIPASLKGGRCHPHPSASQCAPAAPPWEAAEKQALSGAGPEPLLFEAEAPSLQMLVESQALDTPSPITGVSVLGGLPLSTWLSGAGIDSQAPHPGWVILRCRLFTIFPSPTGGSAHHRAGGVCVWGGDRIKDTPLWATSPSFCQPPPPPSKLIMLEFFPAPGRAQVETLFRVELCLPKDVLTSQAPGPVGVALFPGSRVFADGIR